MGVDKKIFPEEDLFAGTVTAVSGLVLSAELNTITNGKLFPFIGKLVTEAPDVIKAKLASREDQFAGNTLKVPQSVEDIDDGHYSYY